MESKGVAASRVYQDFEPSMEWVPEDDSETLLVYLPGFAKEQLRVQLRSRNLIISGERKLQQNTWSRFRVEFPVSVTCDLNKISAKFEGNILFVRQPKFITPTPKPEDDKSVAAPTAPQKQPVDDQSDVVGQKTYDAPTTKLQENKDEYVPKPVVEEEKATTEEQGVSENALSKNNKGVAAYRQLGKTALDQYKRAAGVFALKLKRSTNAVNTIVILFAGLVIGIYVSNSIKAWSQAN